MCENLVTAANIRPEAKEKSSRRIVHFERSVQFTRPRVRAEWLLLYASNICCSSGNDVVQETKKSF